MKSHNDKYGAGFTLDELQAHYQALIGDSTGLSRQQLLDGLRGSEFDEHAYSNLRLYNPNAGVAQVFPKGRWS